MTQDTKDDLGGLVVLFALLLGAFFAGSWWGRLPDDHWARSPVANACGTTWARERYRVREPERQRFESVPRMPQEGERVAEANL